MSHNRKNEERNCTQREDSGDGEGGILLVRFNRTLCSDDGGHAADRRPHREQRDKLRLEVEGFAQIGHEGQAERDLHEHQQQSDAAELCNIAQNEASAEENDARLQPELVGSNAAPEELRHANGIRDDQPNKNGPQDVLDVGEHKVVRLPIPGDVLLKEFASDADNREQKDSGDQAQRVGSGLNRRRGRGAFRGLGCRSECDSFGHKGFLASRESVELPGNYFEDAHAH